MQPGVSTCFQVPKLVSSRQPELRGGRLPGFIQRPEVDPDHRAGRNQFRRWGEIENWIWARNWPGLKQHDGSPLTRGRPRGPPPPPAAGGSIPAHTRGRVVAGSGQPVNLAGFRPYPSRGALRTDRVAPTSEAPRGASGPPQRAPLDADRERGRSPVRANRHRAATEGSLDRRAAHATAPRKGAPDA